MLRRQVVIGWSMLALIVAWPLALWGADWETQEPKTPIARLDVQPARVDWLPQVDYESLVLTVAGPGDLFIHQGFGPGEAPHLNLIDSKGVRLPDGIYAYELRVVPRLDREVREKLIQARESGDSSAVEELRQTGQLAEQSLQWGSVSVRDGSFVTTGQPANRAAGSRGSGSQPQLGSVTAAQVISDFVCIGDGCVAGDDDFPVLKLKGPTPWLRFEDTGSFGPARKWQIEINDFIGGSAHFGIRDLDGGTVPFTLVADAPDHSLYVRSNGNVGLGTSTPANHLHVLGSAGTNKVLVEEANATTTPRELLEIRNNGGSVQIFEDTSVAQRWAAGTFGANFLLDEQAHSGVEYVFTNTGNMTIAGTLTQGSSRALKTDLASLDPKDVLARVSALPVSLWSYKTETAVRHVGPMAEDFHQAFGLGEDDKHIAPGDQAGVALLAVQGLNQVLQSKAEEIVTLQRENADLTKRVAALEALLSKVMDTVQPQPTPAEEN